MSLVRQSVREGYLPCDWHDHKTDVVKTISHYLALSGDCVSLEDGYYHKKLDADCYAFDELNERYIYDDESITVYEGEHSYFVTHESYCNHYYRYGSEYFTREGLDARDLVITAEGNITRSCDAYYWESDIEYHETDEQDDDEGAHSRIWGYHEGPGTPDYREMPGEPGIGFEVEKGEAPVFCGHGDKEGLFDATGCVIEEDGSVDWELKTPIYPLFSERIERDWLPRIAGAINATDHDCAGGHIHLSMPPKDGNQLFDFCRLYLPLFMAMYPQRLERDYCKGKPETQLKRDEDKHQAIRIWDNRIELRFPAKVYDMRSLLFRLNFCRLMIRRDCRNIFAVTRSAFDQGTELGKLLQQMYGGREHMLLLRILEVAKKYFNTDLLREKSIETLLTDLKSKKLCA